MRLNALAVFHQDFDFPLLPALYIGDSVSK